MTPENTPDRFVDHILQALTDLDLLTPGASCEALDAFRDIVKVQLRQHRLRIPRFYSTDQETS